MPIQKRHVPATIAVATLLCAAGCGVRDATAPGVPAPKTEAASTGYAFPNISKRRPAPAGSGDIDRAETAAANQPDNAAAQRQLGIAYYSTAGYKAATNVLETAVRLDPADGLAWLYLGYARMGAGQPEKALEAFDVAAKASLTNTDKAAAKAESGTIRYQALRDDKGAMEDFKAALALNPKEGTAALALGTNAAEGQDAAAARRYFELAAQALPAGPDRASVFACLGRLAEEAKDKPKAHSWYAKALADDKANAWAKVRFPLTAP
jgi:tetratricopeptide (TPR) repeat protein